MYGLAANLFVPTRTDLKKINKIAANKIQLTEKKVYHW